MFEKKLREQLESVQRVIIKCGTSVVSHKNGIIALGRVAYIVEQVVTLLLEGKQILVVSSGAVSVGKQKLRTAQLQTQIPYRGKRSRDPFDLPQSPATDSRACAAAGQSGLFFLLYSRKLMIYYYCSFIFISI